MNKMIAWGLAAGLVFSGVGTMWARPGAPREEQGGRGGPGGWMRSPKMSLDRTWRGIGRLQGALSRDQARRMVALVRPWNSRPTMSDVEAQALNSRLSSILTSAQKSQMAQMRPGPRDGRGSGGGQGQGRRPGGPPPKFDWAKMEQMRSQMEGFLKVVNPFYPPGKSRSMQGMPDFMRQVMNRRYQESHATLEALARKAA